MQGNARGTSAVFCEACNTAIRLEQDRDGAYWLRCACGIAEPVPCTWRHAEWTGARKVR